MENYFNIRYEFDKRAVLQAIDEALLLGKPGYICVSDGVILSTVNRDPDYRQVVDGAMFSICDSGYVPLYLRWIYGIGTSPVLRKRDFYGYCPYEAI